jgi:hypothetical protein
MIDTIPKPFVFVLMPFSQEFDDVYQLGIKPACIEAEAYCERVDEQIFQESILDRIYNQISKADFIVADMTRRNPNVFYETGYAHALGKRAILLTRNAKDIPFDLKHYPHIVYGNRIAALRDELQRRLSWYINAPTQANMLLGSELEFLIDGKPLAKGEFLAPKETDSYKIQLQIHNPGTRIFRGNRIKLAMIFNGDFWSKTYFNPIRLPNSQYMIPIDELSDLFPQEWVMRPFPIAHRIDRVPQGAVFNLILRIFTEIGVTDIPFSVRLME